MSVLEDLIEEVELEQKLRKKLKKSRKNISVQFVDMVKDPSLLSNQMISERNANAGPLIQAAFRGPIKPEPVVINSNQSGENRLAKSVMNILDGSGTTIERLAFEVNPHTGGHYDTLYRRKLKLLPNEVLRRIAVQDDLVAAIIGARSNMLSAFGRVQPDRFSTGFVIEADIQHVDSLDAQGKKELNDRIARAESLLLTCGQTKGWPDHKDLHFSSFLYQQTRNALIFGYCATEIIYTTNFDGSKQPHSFRPIDACTLYQSRPFNDEAEAVRKNALSLLESVRNKKLIPEKFIEGDYPWVQVIQGRPDQVFTNEECVVQNFYPTTDIELEGYPLTPLDTVITAVTTHINIGTHNKLYFQSGRAARGMIVFKTEDLNDNTLDPIRQQFMANVNGVGNSWRTPIFAVGADDDVSWQSIDNSGRDMEFQYLSDSNARTLLSAFHMSPEELPGCAHLSRGSTSQALSESNKEYILTAARDTGLRPLMSQMQNYVNKIFQIMDPDLAAVASVKFVGLEAETPEKEAQRNQEDMAIHKTLDEVLHEVDKKPVGKAWGGEFPLNQPWQQALFQHRYVGDIMEHFFGVEGASKDPTLRYIRDPMWFQWQQLQMQAQQAQQQAQQPQQEPQPEEGQSDLARSADQLIGSLSKAEVKDSKKKILLHQRKVINQTLEAFERESASAISDILAGVKKVK